MLGSKEIKKKALADLKGNWVPGALLCILIIFVIVAFSAIAGIIAAFENVYLNVFVSIVTFIVMLPISIGVANVFRNLIGGNVLKISDVFMPYKKMLKSSILTQFVRVLYIQLWTLLLIVPGIIKSISYSQTSFILLEDPTLSPSEAITKSRKMMYGFKWRYFKLQLSFIGWFILSLFTLFIGFLWLVPYVQASLANFYCELKQHHEEVVTFDDAKIADETIA